jgi:hypothetical protein
MLNNIVDAPLVNIWRRVRLMANDECPRDWVIELAARATVLEELIAKMLKDGLEVVPFDVGGRRDSA